MARSRTSPYFTSSGVEIYHGDALAVLQELPDSSINCCVTSPPYWGLRDYGVDGQLGLESTPEEFVEKIVGVFREVRRVLREDGTLWLNLGDSYARNPAKGGSGTFNGRNGIGERYGEAQSAKVGSSNGMVGRADRRGMRASAEGLKDKNLVGIPWLVAFALRVDGWYLRQDIIWHKPNPMPESVRDRCTKAHEYIFLLSKSARYYFDGDAIAEPAKYAGDDRGARGDSRRGTECNSVSGATGEDRNKRSVWTVTTAPFKGAHFATFPPKLIEPCILAGCPEGGVVLDPFSGSGTTGEVARKHGRRHVGIELNADYIELSKKRFKQQVLY